MTRVKRGNVARKRRKKLLKLKAETSFAVAIDESIYNSDTYKDWIKGGLVNYIVIKLSNFIF